MCAGPGRAADSRPVQMYTDNNQLHNNASINRSSARDPSMLQVLLTLAGSQHHTDRSVVDNSLRPISGSVSSITGILSGALTSMERSR